MNKKGFTLMELMVSIVLIAIIMVFLVKLLVDVKYDVLNELYDTKNQFNRAEVLKFVQSDFIKDYRIINIAGTKQTNKRIITFTSNTKNGDATSIKTSTLEVSDSTISYTNINGSKKTWDLEKNNSETKFRIDKIAYKKVGALESDDNDPNDYLVIINIPVYVDDTITDNSKDNKMDNIILTLYGNIPNSISNTDSLFND